MKNSIWNVEYAMLPSNDKSEAGWMNGWEKNVLAKTGEIALEKVKASVLKEKWNESDEDGKETKKIVRVVGFRLDGIKKLHDIDL